MAKKRRRSRYFHAPVISDRVEIDNASGLSVESLVQARAEARFPVLVVRTPSYSPYHKGQIERRFQQMRVGDSVRRPALSMSAKSSDTRFGKRYRTGRSK